jgi:Fe-S oxidoreductase
MEKVLDKKDEQLEKIKELLVKRLDRRLLTALEVCVHCGICTESCHVYRSDPRIEHTPYYRAEMIRRLYRYLFDPVGRKAPGWVGAKPPTEHFLKDLAHAAFATCTLCQRCTVECPFGVDTAEVMRAARSILTELGLAPEMLVELANAAMAKEDNVALFREIYQEQVKDLEKEVQERLGMPEATIPMSKEGARILYTPLAGAHTIIPQAMIFNKAGESWTLGMFEGSNYALFLADREKAIKITERIIKEAEQFKVQEIVLTECGHAYSVLRWEYARWTGKQVPFRVRSIIEVMDEYIREGRIKLDPSRNPEPVTYHDSCNLGRKGGLFEEPRRVVKAAALDFREMTPNKLHAFCCGAGSGLVALEEYSDLRIKSGKVKADQIKATGAKVVVTSCDNCRHQLLELNEHYNLNIEVTSLSELVVKALV